MWKLLKGHTFVLYRPIISESPIQKQATRLISASSDANNITNLKPWTQIPGPKSYPFIGPMLSFIPGGQFYNIDAIEMTKALFATYGPIVKIDKFVYTKPTIFLFDAQNSAQILRREDHIPIRAGMDSLQYYRKTKKNKPPGSFSGLTTDQGETWHKFRSIVNPVLLHPKTIRLYTDVIDRISLEMIERLKLLRDSKNMISDIDKEMSLWAMESVGAIALGCRLKCFDNNLENYSTAARQLVETSKIALKALYELDYKPSIWKYYPTKTYTIAMEYYQKQETLARHFIGEAKKEFKLNPKPDDQKSVLEKLLDINEEVAFIMASDMLIAGVDTVSNSVLGALYLLASNPNKQFKLRAELKSNENKKPYLKACVKEAMRMMPAASGNLRETTEEYNILGYKIPKGVDVVFCHQDMSRMDNYFVKPHEFIPERWLVEKDDHLHYKNGHPFAFNPFGFGTRACIGRRVAELEIETFIARAIENFEIQWNGPPPEVKQTLVNCVIGPFNFIFRDAPK